jgi:hypothetical protein
MDASGVFSAGTVEERGPVRGRSGGPRHLLYYTRPIRVPLAGQGIAPKGTNRPSSTRPARTVYTVTPEGIRNGPAGVSEIVAAD